MEEPTTGAAGVHISNVPKIPAQENHPKYSKPSYTKLLFEALCVTLKTWRQSKCPKTRGWSTEFAAFKNDIYEVCVITWEVLMMV